MRDRLGIEIAEWASGLRRTVGKKGMDLGISCPRAPRFLPAKSH